MFGKIRKLDGLCFTIDLEWAVDEVLDSTLQIFQDFDVPVTLFCTHRVDRKPVELAIHPNFRLEGDIVRRFLASSPSVSKLSQRELYTFVVQQFLTMVPGAKGVRAHSRHMDTELLRLYDTLGLVYDSSLGMLMQESAPFYITEKLIEFPIYYLDHADVVNNFTGFDLKQLALDRPGLKVLDFHPNLVFINAESESHYHASRACYHDPEGLKDFVNPGRGVRTLLLDLLDYVKRHSIPCFTLSQASRLVRG